MNGFELAQAALTRAPGLSTSERLILAIICESCDRKGVAYTSAQETLAAMSDTSVRTVRNALAELESLGWIRRSRRARQNGERAVDLITVVPSGQDKRGRFEFRRPRVRIETAPAVVEPTQRIIPLKAVVGGSDQGDNRQPLPVGQPATIAGSEPANRQHLPVVPPATIAGHIQTSLIEDSYKPERSSRPPLESGDPPAPEGDAAKRAAIVAETLAHLDSITASQKAIRLKRSA